MKKETVSYVKHILESDYVKLDVLNTVLALFVIVFALIALINDGNASYFGAVFVLGGVLAVFNLIKAIQQRSLTAVIAFFSGAVVMTAMSVLVYVFLV